MRVIIANRHILCPPKSIVIDVRGMAFGRENEWRSFSATKSAVSFNILACLVIRSPGFVPYADLIDVVWGGDPEGGPIQPSNNVSRVCHRHRDLLKWLGIEVRGRAWGVATRRRHDVERRAAA